MRGKRGKQERWSYWAGGNRIKIKRGYGTVENPIMRGRNTKWYQREKKDTRKEEGVSFSAWKKGAEAIRSILNEEEEGDTQMVDPFPKYGLEKGQGEFGGLVNTD